MAFPADFQRRVKCTIQASLVDAGLSFFPVLLTEVCLPQGNDEIFDADGLHPAQDGGGDLRFSSDEAGLNRIPCEIVTFVTDNIPGNGVAEIWVAVPSISSSVDTDIWLWWESDSAEVQPAEDAAFGKENTWDENGADNFVLVQHLNEDPSGVGDVAIDSTLFDNDGDPTGMTAGDLVTGAFGAGLQGSAWDFDGSNDSVSLGTDSSLDLTDESFVISAWVRPVSSPPSEAVYFSIHNAESTNESIHIRTFSNEAIRFGYFNDDLTSSTGELTNGSWNYVTVTRDQPGDESLIFNAGVEIADGSQGPFEGPPARVDIGRWGSTDTQHFEGTIDEVRVSSGVIRDDAWFGAEFENQNDPNAFIVEGTPEAVAPGVTVTDVDGDEDVDDEQTSVTITGTQFEASQGTGNVEIGDDPDYATANKISQTETSWADTSIDITVDLGAQSPGAKWLFVTNDSAERNDPGFAITVHRVQALRMSASDNIAASGEDTTAQLTAPATKTTGDFDAGRIQDDENPADAVNITLDNYTEMEWCMLAKDGAREVQYDFRVTVSGTVLDTYTLTPQLTIAVAVGPELGSLTLAGVGR